MLRTRLAGWVPSTFEMYCQAWQQYGGSTYNHPQVLSYLESLHTGALRYFHKMHKGQLIGACFCGPDKELQHPYKDVPIIAENIMLPLSPEYKGYLPIKTKWLSDYHQGQFLNLHYGRANRRSVCLVKEQFSKSTTKRRNCDSRRFLEQGGEIVPVAEYTPDELGAIYVRLFNLRWAGRYQYRNEEGLVAFLHAVRDLLFGHVLLWEGQPCAYDLIYQAQCPKWNYFDDFNGGYDPGVTGFSPGSILMWENISAARRQSAEQGKECLFSLGLASHKWPYKLLWAAERRMGKTLF